MGRLREAERPANHVLELFGADPGFIGRQTLLRGVFVGGAGGLLAGAFAALGGAAGSAVVGQLFGAAVTIPAWQWSLVGLPVAVGLVEGLVAGWWVGRGQTGERRRHRDLELERVMNHE